MKPFNYHGSNIFLPISSAVGLTIDLVNIVFLKRIFFVFCNNTRLFFTPYIYVQQPHLTSRHGVANVFKRGTLWGQQILVDGV